MLFDCIIPILRYYIRYNGVGVASKEKCVVQGGGGEVGGSILAQQEGSESSSRCSPDKAH